MSYHVEKTRFKELPEEIIVREDGCMDAYKNEGEPIADYVYRLEKSCELFWMWSDPEDGDCFRCSLCDGTAHSFGLEPRFCPRCGSRVTKIHYGKDVIICP